MIEIDRLEQEIVQFHENLMGLDSVIKYVKEYTVAAHQQNQQIDEMNKALNEQLAEMQALIKEAEARVMHREDGVLGQVVGIKQQLAEMQAQAKAAEARAIQSENNLLIQAMDSKQKTKIYFVCIAATLVISIILAIF